MQQKKRGKKPVKRELISSYIYKNILSGTWPAGGRLPPRKWFEEHFNAMEHTVQDAFRGLLDAGFLITSGRGGTTVSVNPPFISHYAVLMYGTKKLESYFSKALYRSVEILRKRGRTIKVFFDLDSEFDDPEHVKLYERIRLHHFAGVFLAAPPLHRERLDLFQEKEIPITGFYLKKCSDSPFHVPVKPIYCGDGNYERIYDIMFSYLRDEGCKSVGMIRNVGDFDLQEQKNWQAFTRKYGMDMPAEYYQPMTETYSLAENVIRLLFARKGRNMHPDGLVVLNENFLPIIIRVLREQYGANAEKQVKIVSICNYPALPELDFPVKYAGFDHLKILESGLNIIDCIRTGQPIPPMPDFLFK